LATWARDVAELCDAFKDNVNKLNVETWW